jgi:hypothetical protein
MRDTDRSKHDCKRSKMCQSTRARFHDTMLFCAPPGSLGFVNSPRSDWMTSPLFVTVLEHTKRHTRCSGEDRIFLLSDNHESHCNFKAIVYAREYDII